MDSWGEDAIPFGRWRIDPGDLEIDVFRSSDEAIATVRIRHVPSGLVVEAKHASTLSARNQAMRELAERLDD
jgi:protein subunit release factor A